MSSDAISELLTMVWRRWKSSSPVGRGSITQEQYWILKTLAEEGPMMVKEIAESVGCTPSSASISVKRLEKVGLLSRRRQEDDERVVRVALTVRGKERVEEWRRSREDSMKSLVENLDQRERRELEAILSKALKHGRSPEGNKN